MTVLHPELPGDAELLAELGRLLDSPVLDAPSTPAAKPSPADVALLVILIGDRSWRGA